MIWLAIIVLVAAGYLAVMWWMAKQDVTTQPRVDMFLCEKHGAIPVKYLQHLPVPGMEDGVTMCPMCFEDRFREAERRTVR